MRTRIVRWLAGLACLGLVVAMAAWVTPVEAGNPTETGRWLPFGGGAEPAQPTMVLLDAGAAAINLRADK